MTLDRRRFLQLGALGIVAAVTDTAWATADAGVGASGDRPLLVAMLGPERVRQLGSHYRASTPSENSAEALRAALSKDRTLRIPFIKSGSHMDEIRDDFVAGRTVIVDGWVLAVTEARQAALFSLARA
jgi:hypothetical protein